MWTVCLHFTFDLEYSDYPRLLTVIYCKNPIPLVQKQFPLKTCIRHSFIRNILKLLMGSAKMKFQCIPIFLYIFESIPEGLSCIIQSY